MNLSQRNGVMTSLVTTMKQTVKREDIDFVWIGAPTYIHKEMVIEAAKAGKHILCEKSCALTYCDCLEMLAAANKTGVVH